MGRADLPAPSDTRGPCGVPFPVCPARIFADTTSSDGKVKKNPAAPLLLSKKLHGEKELYLQGSREGP